MHELAIAESILTAVSDAAAAYPGQRVREIRLTIGQLRAIEPETMRLCWEAVTRETSMEAAVIKITEATASGKCRGCDLVFETEELVFVCPECGGADVETVGGKELVVDSIDLVEERGV